MEHLSQKNKGIGAEEIKFILSLIKKNLLFIVLLPLGAFLIASFYAHRLNEVHAVQMQLLLKSGDTYDYQNAIYRNIGYYEQYADVTNQKRILTSYDLIAEACGRLKYEVSYFIKGRVKTTSLYKEVPFLIDIQLLNNRLFEQKFGFKIIDHEKYELTYYKNDNFVRAQHYFGEKAVTVDYVITANKQPILTAESASELSLIHYEFIRHRPTYLINKYLYNVTVTNVEYTSILDVMIQDEIPERAKMFMDTLAKVYIESTLQNEYDVNTNTLKFIEKQIEQVLVVLDSLEREEDNYRKMKGILDLAKESETSYLMLVENEAKQRKLQFNLKSLENLERYVYDVQSKRFLPPETYVLDDDGYLSKTISKLYNAQLNKVELLKDGYTKDNPVIVRLDSSLQEIRKDMITYIHGAKSAINEQIDILDVQVRKAAGEIKAIPTSERDLQAIERKIAVNLKMYEFLLERRTNTTITRAGIVSQTKVVEAPRYLGVVSPDKTKIKGTGVIIGIVLAFLIGTIRFLFFFKIDSIDELKKITNVPIIGGVPMKKQVEYVNILGLKARSMLVEAYRNVRANLMYLTDIPDGKGASIMITSILPGEGKTFTSANVAIILGRSGKRVLYVDVDMHKPKVHRVFGDDHTNGLSQFLSGQCPIEDVIAKTEVDALEYISAGPVPPNASELVLSDQLEQLLVYGKDNYDFIILDTPPVGLISDALILLSKVDIGLFVADSEKLKKQSVQYITDILNKCTAEKTGIILNRIKANNYRYGNYLYSRYGYGYQYGYKYGNGYYGYEESE